MTANVILKKDAERRIKAGHLWIFSNDIDTQQSPLKNYKPGELVRIQTAFGTPIAIGYINPHCLLCIRVLSLNHTDKINTDFFIEKINTAVLKRKQLFSDHYFRAVFGEADRLPGLVIDQFDHTIVIQLNTAGMENLKKNILEAAEKIFCPDNIVLKCDSTERVNEGLHHYTEMAKGEYSRNMFVRENHCLYEIDLKNAQKTGWFYDHRLNRARITHYCKDKNVLDVFSYCGAFSIPAAKVAKTVTAIDRSDIALQQLQKNAHHNNCNNIDMLCGDAAECMQQLLSQQKKFDVVILDPPALIKRKKDIPVGEKHYQKLNELALALLSDQGILLSASCSMHLSRDQLLNTMRRAAIAVKKQVSVMEQLHQGPDHPIHPAIAETDYLKGFIVFVTSTSLEK